MKWLPLQAAPEEEPEEPEGPRSASSYVFVTVMFDGGMGDGPSVIDSYPPCVEWFDYECDNGMLECLMGCEGKWPEWMLREGIAPGQQFVIRVSEPSYTKDCWGEYDVDYGDWEIVQRQPLPDGVAGMLWFAWFRDIEYRRIEIMSEGACMTVELQQAVTKLIDTITGRVKYNGESLIKTSDVAEFLKVSPATVKRWADSGSLPSFRTPGAHRMFKIVDVAKFALSRPQKPEEPSNVVE